MRRLGSGLGVGFRAPLAQWIATRPPEIGCLEVTAEHFFDGGEEVLEELARDYPVLVHGLGLSLGTPGPLDHETLGRFARVAQVARAPWVSEHLAFTRAGDLDLGHLNPLPPTRETLRVLAEHALEVAETCGRPLLLENVTSQLRLEGDLAETDLLNRLCEEAGCGLLLDVTNLLINARNHRFDPLAWLHEIEPRHIVQLHVVGYSEVDGRLYDHHSEPLQDDVLELLARVVEHAPVRAVILERDAGLSAPAELVAELRRLARVLSGGSDVREAVVGGLP